MLATDMKDGEKPNVVNAYGDDVALPLPNRNQIMALALFVLCVAYF